MTAHHRGAECTETGKFYCSQERASNKFKQRHYPEIFRISPIGFRESATTDSFCFLEFEMRPRFDLDETYAIAYLIKKEFSFVGWVKPGKIRWVSYFHPTCAAANVYKTVRP